MLEFVKALATPVAASAVALLAIRTFRAQKLIERRLSWYEATYRALGRVGPLLGLEARVDASRQQGYVQRADQGVQELAELMAEGWLYARQSGFEAIQRASEAISNVLAHSPRPLSIQAADSIGEQCHLLAIALAKEMRAELKAGNVTALEGITRTTHVP